MTSPRSDQDGLDLAELRRTVRRITQRAIDRVADDTHATRAHDLFVVLGRDEPFPKAHLGLDLFATGLVDAFGQMQLEGPAAYQADVLLHAQVLAPGSDATRAALESALVETMAELLGPGVHPSVAVRPVGATSRETAVLQVSFPQGTDLVSFASGFNTRDYFRWHVDLLSLPGVGEVTSEPCTVLGVDVGLGDLLPPNLMISFAIVGELEPTVRGVLADLDRRLADAIRPTEIAVGISVTIDDATPETVRTEIERWRARGYPLFDPDEEPTVRPGEPTTLMFEFPVTQPPVSPVRAEPVEPRR